MKVVDSYGIECVIMGSDALLQHHPLLSRIRKGKRKPFWVLPVDKSRMFPNPFWGVGLANKVPTGLFSVSSQNSAYKMFSHRIKKRMASSLMNMRYISVRDEWTKDMILSILPNKNIPITPDPVFAFNQNAGEFIPSKEKLLSKFRLPQNYLLLSLFSQSLSEKTLLELKQKMSQKGVSCVVLHTPTGHGFKHPFDYEVTPPLTPLEWYGLIKYSYAYVGSNMHPIVVCLHNTIPCFSIDNWGRENFWGKKLDDGSSKVLHIMNQFQVGCNHRVIQQGTCHVSADEIVSALERFPKETVKKQAEQYLKKYNVFMADLISSLKTCDS